MLYLGVDVDPTLFFMVFVISLFLKSSPAWSRPAFPLMQWLRSSDCSTDKRTKKKKRKKTGHARTRFSFVYVFLQSPIRQSECRPPVRTILYYKSRTGAVGARSGIFNRLLFSLVGLENLAVCQK